MWSKDRPITSEVVKVVHDDSHEQVDDLKHKQHHFSLDKISCLVRPWNTVKITKMVHKSKSPYTNQRKFGMYSVQENLNDKVCAGWPSYHWPLCRQSWILYWSKILPYISSVFPFLSLINTVMCVSSLLPIHILKGISFPLPHQHSQRSVLSPSSQHSQGSFPSPPYQHSTLTHIFRGVSSLLSQESFPSPPQWIFSWKFPFPSLLKAIFFLSLTNTVKGTAFSIM